MAILTPPGWVADQMNRAIHAVGTDTPEHYWHRDDASPDTPVVRRIGFSDVRDAIRLGMADFGASRTDVLFLCVFYPIVGLLLARFASGGGMIPLLFPLASGFALIGPIAAIGLNEMSRLRESGHEVNWLHAFSVLRSPAVVAITMLGVLLAAIFVVWIFAADLIFQVTLGPVYPPSVGEFLQNVFMTSAGWLMIAIGVSVGFVFAATVLAISLVSFPLLLDRNLSAMAAVTTSVRAVAANPGPVAFWAMIVVAGLVVGSIPLFLGLVVVLPVLGHATWHLYRKLITWTPSVR